MDKNEGVWRISKPHGGRISKARPLFSLDKENLWVPLGNLICCFSIKTGILVTSYSHKSAVISLDFMNSTSDNLIISTCRGGQIIIYNTNTKKIEFSSEIKKNIWRSAYSSYTNCHYYANNKENNSTINIFKINSDKIEDIGSIHLPDTGVIKQITVSNSGKILACISGKSLLFCRLDQKSPLFIKLDHEIQLITMNISNDDSTIVTGDISGKISHWHISDSSYAKSTFHWHSHAVECIIHSPDNSLLYTGGHEGVLVLWHLAANTKTFLPKFPSELSSLSISHDGTMLALCLSNNSIHVLNTATLKEIQRISMLHFDTQNFSATQDPGTKKIAISTNNDAIQFYDMQNKRISEILDVGFKNYASKTFNEIPNPLIISHIVFSENCEHMLTVEQNMKENIKMPIKYEQTILKFWKKNTLGNMQLAAIIENPHHGKRIEKAIFIGKSVENPMFLTTGNDNKFMIWEYTETDENKQNWICKTVGSYKDLKIYNIKAIGSRLFILHENNTLTIWDISNNFLLIDLFYLPYKPEIKIGEISTNGQYFIGGCTESIAAFDILNKNFIWDLKITATKIINDPSMESECCILLNPIENMENCESCVIFINYANPSPLTICKFKGKSIIVNAIYADLKYKRNSLIVFKNNGQLQKLSYVFKGEKEPKFEKSEISENLIETKTIYANKSDISKVTSDPTLAKRTYEMIIRDQLSNFTKFLEKYRYYEIPDQGVIFEKLLDSMLVKNEEKIMEIDNFEQENTKKEEKNNENFINMTDIKENNIPEDHLSSLNLTL